MDGSRWMYAFDVFRDHGSFFPGFTNPDRRAFRTVSKACLGLHDGEVTGVKGALPLLWGLRMGENPHTMWDNMQHGTHHVDALRLHDALELNRFPKLVNLGVTLDLSTYVSTFLRFE
jgi:hypothetical protein